ncbi:NosD domain-containing protein [Psychromonas ossibalaenae]|uniref:NosD domain-containing protein n=1 Tax=Psychromonas ossibalaenae TaxID=444922 RepID=UPI00037DB748|nr:NosD domain-containing protein [Psychromonas ossibalaenae]
MYINMIKLISPIFLLLFITAGCTSGDKAHSLSSAAQETASVFGAESASEVDAEFETFSGPVSGPIVIPALIPESFGFTSTLYIDGRLKQSCADYNASSRTCGDGSDRAFFSIAAAGTAAAPGVNFLIRGGDYKEALHISTSGTVDAYLGYSAYPGEVVTLVDVDSWDGAEEYGAIWLDQVSYVLVNEIDVRGSIGFGRLLNSHYNIISNSNFNESKIWNDGRGASKRGGLYIAFSHYNRILNNHFYKGTDSLAMVHSNHNLVEGNRMDLAGHDIWNIKCGSYNVIRNNHFSNKNQKIGSVFDCESSTLAWHGNGKFAQRKAVLNSTQYNLIEGNIFRDSVRYYSTSGGNGIQYAGQNGIIRGNRFFRVNAGLAMAAYRDEATYNYGNRIYNNTFHNNWCTAVAIGKPINKMGDNQYKNNILWDNQGLSQEQCYETSAKQILLLSRLKSGDRFMNNNIASRAGEDVLGLWGNPSAYTIRDFENSLGTISFSENLAVDPLFTNEYENDYRLRSASPMVDSGAFLSTVTSASGSGSKLQLADVNSFYDGFAIPGEVGDRVQIEGRTATAVIIHVNHKHKTITLDKALTWKRGEGIGLSYNGLRPDIGAFER